MKLINSILLSSLLFQSSISLAQKSSVTVTASVRVNNSVELSINQPTEVLTVDENGKESVSMQMNSTSDVTYYGRAFTRLSVRGTKEKSATTNQRGIIEFKILEEATDLIIEY